MATSIEAVYEGGVLRPVQPLELPEGTHVEVLVIARARPGSKTPAELIAEIAALPLEGKTDPFSGEDHDAVLYPKSGPL
jgi:predicted DNA-binding antitoxin AbrB/MazE fold protein